MPYIKSEDYRRAGREPTTPGELNYAMTLRANLHFLVVSTLGDFETQVEELCAGFMERNGVSYTNYNNMIGVLYCCGMELIRRVTNPLYFNQANHCQVILNRIAWTSYHDKLVPYEDIKIAENGDVFPEEIIV